MNPLLGVIAQRKPLAPLIIWVQIILLETNIGLTCVHKLALVNGFQRLYEVITRCLIVFQH